MPDPADPAPPVPPAPDNPVRAYFQLLTEIGIIAQLSRTMLEARLPTGFVMGQFSVLNHLIRVRDGQTPLALARAFQVPKTTMTHSLAVLERHGLVTLAPNPKDGRSKRVWLTEAGRAFRESAIMAMAPDIVALNARLPASEVVGVLPALAALRKVMDAMRDPEDNAD